MKKCTGINCPIQFNLVDPENCKAVETCQYATSPITRADRIRAMSDEELAELLFTWTDCCYFRIADGCEFSKGGCVGNLLAYLKEVADI